MAGLTCARALSSRGERVLLLDKGRAVGGRMSTRRRDDGATFDHGAQYFTIRSPGLARVVEELAARGVVAPFVKERAPNGEARWAGTPTMRAVPQALSLGLEIRLGARVTKLGWDGRTWQVELEGGERLSASRVVVAIPAPQARDLLVASDQPVPERLLAVEVAPCWALMAEVEGSAEPPWTVRGAAPFSWLCRQNDDGPRQRWVGHADSEFSARHLERSQEEVAAQLVPPLLEIVGAKRLVTAVAHRWRFARTTKPAGSPAIDVLERRLVLAGDYCLGDRVEDAFESGLAAAELLSPSLTGC
jgi:hypothetical protein